MAIVTANRIQDDFSSMSSPPLRWHGPQVVHSGLRTDDPIFRIGRFPFSLGPPLPHTQLRLRNSTGQSRAIDGDGRHLFLGN